jgi:hypothetical protein
LSDDFIAINDKLTRLAWGLYAKQNGRERELDSKEIERAKRAWEAEHSVTDNVASVQSSIF